MTMTHTMWTLKQQQQQQQGKEVLQQQLQAPPLRQPRRRQRKEQDCKRHLSRIVLSAVSPQQQHPHALVQPSSLSLSSSREMVLTTAASHSRYNRDCSSSTGSSKNVPQPQQRRQRQQQRRHQQQVLFPISTSSSTARTLVMLIIMTVLFTITTRISALELVGFSIINIDSGIEVVPVATVPPNDESSVHSLVVPPALYSKLALKAILSSSSSTTGSLQFRLQSGMPSSNSEYVVTVRRPPFQILLPVADNVTAVPMLKWYVYASNNPDDLFPDVSTTTANRVPPPLITEYVTAVLYTAQQESMAVLPHSKALHLNTLSFLPQDPLQYVMPTPPSDPNPSTPAGPPSPTPPDILNNNKTAVPTASPTRLRTTNMPVVVGTPPPITNSSTTTKAPTQRPVPRQTPAPVVSTRKPVVVTTPTRKPVVPPSRQTVAPTDPPYVRPGSRE